MRRSLLEQDGLETHSGRLDETSVQNGSVHATDAKQAILRTGPGSNDGDFSGM